eukprot:1691165-Pleurochrysis_carterae.AAC.1
MAHAGKYVKSSLFALSDGRLAASSTSPTCSQYFLPSTSMRSRTSAGACRPMCTGRLEQPAQASLKSSYSPSFSSSRTMNAFAS